MPKFKVWDELNCDEESADDVEACNAQTAAGLYAENDVDGSIDGLYFKGAQPIMVRHEDGKLERFDVSAEAQPVFYASLAKYQPKAAANG